MESLFALRDVRQKNGPRAAKKRIKTDRNANLMNGIIPKTHVCLEMARHK